MGEYFYRFEKKTGYAKIFKWVKGRAVYIRSLGTAEKLDRRLKKYEEDNN